METEKTQERLQAEKDAMDVSGYSELKADLSMNSHTGDDTKQKTLQPSKKIFSANDSRTETVILEK